jgi:fatty acid desaturase
LEEVRGIPPAQDSERLDDADAGAETRLIQHRTSPALIVHELAEPSASRGLLETGGTWALLALIIGAYLWHPRPWTYLAAFVLVASRQYALLILMHDAFHCLLHPERRVNDMVGAWSIGAPCGSSYWVSRGSHLEHHRKLGESNDPELFLYSAGPPRPKHGVGAFTRHFLRLILGDQILHTHLGPETGQSVQFASRLGSALRRLLPVVVAQLALLVLFTLAGSWQSYFTLWILPLVTLVVLLNGVRVFCDHANHTDEPGDEQHRLVSYLSSPLERFFVAPFHMNYHAEHHLFSYVPHYRLPTLRKRLMASQEYAATVQWRAGYIAFVNEFLRGRP